MGLSREQWEKAAAAAAEMDPSSRGFFSTLARVVGCSRKVIERAWNQSSGDMPPIRDHVFMPQIEARALRDELEDTVEEDRIQLIEQKAERVRREDDARARTDALRTRAEENEMIREARRGAIALVKQGNDLIEAYDVISSKFPTIMINIAEKISDGDSLEIDDINNLSVILWRLQQSHKGMIEGIHRLVQVERLVLGEPTEVVGVFDSGAVPGTPEALLEHIEEKKAALQRIAERKAQNEDMDD